MCVSESRSALFNRAAFFGVMTAVATPLLLGPEAIAEAADAHIALPPPQGALTNGNAHAMRIAQRSPYVRALYGNVEALAHTITATVLREDVLAMLRNPAPDFAKHAPTPQARTAIRDALAAAGFVKPDAAVSGIFPPGTEAASP
jgi:hypothetical protein